MSEKTQYWRDAVLNAMRGTNITGFSAYVGLISSGTTELSGSGYARQLCGFSAPTTEGPVRQITNASEILFGPASGTWLAANRVGIYDAASSGNLLYVSDLDAPRTAETGDELRFAAGALDVTEA